MNQSYKSLDDELLNEQNLRHKLELDKREFMLQVREKQLQENTVWSVVFSLSITALVMGISGYLILSNVPSPTYPYGHFLNK